jgi:hypothetical protein
MHQVSPALKQSRPTATDPAESSTESDKCKALNGVELEFYIYQTSRDSALVVGVFGFPTAGKLNSSNYLAILSTSYTIYYKTKS